MQLRFAIQKAQPAMRIFDWVLASGSTAYGIYAASWIWIASGAIGFLLAWYNPAERIRKRFTFIKPAPQTVRHSHGRK
jgi:hypothetical protein